VIENDDDQTMLLLIFSRKILKMKFFQYRNIFNIHFSLPAARTGITLVGNSIQIVGVPSDFAPLIFAFTGNGKVTQGMVLWQRLFKQGCFYVAAHNISYVQYKLVANHAELQAFYVLILSLSCCLMSVFLDGTT
jgi:hypothetical protein